MRLYNIIFLIVLSSILCCVNGVSNNLRATTPHDNSAAFASEKQALFGSETGINNNNNQQQQEEEGQEQELHRFLEDLEDERAEERPGSSDFIRPPVDQGLINFGIFMAVVLGLYCIFQIAFCIWGGKSHNPAATLRIAHP